tara:strand:+ start:1575 stop:1985 length:411 start_codon:yes stop_codon:yes gene_type:complete
MNNVCSEVHEILNDFIRREAMYIYSPYNKLKFFTLVDKDDFIHNSDKSIDEYILSHNLEYKWTRLNIKDNFSYKQLKRFEKSELSLDEYIKKHNLYEATLTDSDKDADYIENDIEQYDAYDLDYDNYSDSNDGWGE